MQRHILRKLTSTVAGLALAGLAMAVQSGTLDGQTPATEVLCEDAGLSGALLGICVAYGEAQDCDETTRRAAESPSCERLERNFERISSGSSLAEIFAPHQPIAGQDNDGDGVWDYLDPTLDNYAYSSSVYDAAMQHAVSMQDALLSADSPEKAIDSVNRVARSVECLFHQTPEAMEVIDSLEMALVNTEERLRAYVSITDQLAGHSLSKRSVSEWGASCEPMHGGSQ